MNPYRYTSYSNSSYVWSYFHHFYV